MLRQRNVAILLFERVEVLDFAGPFEVFSRARTEPGLASRRRDDDPSAPFAVFTVAATHDPLAATGGLTVVPRYSFDDCPRVDVLVVPGGFGTRALLDDEATLAWLRETAASASLIVSVCTGALLLAAAGLLDRKQATTHWGAYDLLETTGARDGRTIEVDRGARYVDSSERIITSAGVAAGIDASFHAVEKLLGKEIADETASYIEYSRNRERRMEAQTA